MLKYLVFNVQNLCLLFSFFCEGWYNKLTFYSKTITFLENFCQCWYNIMLETIYDSKNT